jgi:hypothetical protein
VLETIILKAQKNITTLDLSTGQHFTAVTWVLTTDPAFTKKKLGSNDPDFIFIVL